METTPPLIESLKEVFREYGDDLLFAYLFGSRARDVFSQSGDIDIAVYVDNNLAKHFFDVKTDLYIQLSKKLKQNDIDIVIMNQCKNIILLNQIIISGIVICDKDESSRKEYEQKILHSAIDFKFQRKMAMGV